MSHVRLDLVLALAVAACSKSASYSLEDFRRDNAATATQLVNGMESARKAVVHAPSQAIGGACERKGLTLMRDAEERERPPIPASDGNTEVAVPFALQIEGADVPTAEDTHVLFASFHLPSGPALRWAQIFASHTNRPDSGDTCDECKTTAPHDLERAAQVKQLVVLRRRTAPGSPLDVLLVEFPAGKVACGFQIEHPDSPYDPMTGEARVGLDRSTLAAELDKRFGLVLDTAVGSPAMAAARTRYQHLLAGLAVTELPDCAGPPPAGAVRTTAKLLHVYAQTPVLGPDDPNVTVEPSAAVSDDFKAMVAPATPADARDAAIARLAAAPATLVIDVISEQPAVLSSSKNFTPGVVSARQLQFSSDGTPHCQWRTTARNSDSLNVSTFRGKSSNDDLLKASRGELAALIAKAFPSSP
jgi:hypothetical protein